MLINVKVKYGSSRQSIEYFGDNRYLVYMLSKPEEEDSYDELIAMLSKRLGVPAVRIALKKDSGGDKVFDVL